jgi:hypothetical protein
MTCGFGIKRGEACGRRLTYAISTVTGEEVVVFTLADSPRFA